MILATSSGWLIAVEKLSETAHTVTVQDRGEVTAPYTVLKCDPDRKLFDNTNEASAWIDNHPGAGCTDQGCPSHYANDYPSKPDVAKLVEALEGFLAIVSESSGVAGYHLNGEIAHWREFEEVAMAEEALAIYHKQQEEGICSSGK